MIQTHQYWRRALKKLVLRHPYLSHKIDLDVQEETLKHGCKGVYKNLAKDLNMFWKKNEKFKPLTQRNGQYFITVLGPRTRSDLAVFSIRVFDRNTKKRINEISNLIDKPEYLVFSPKYNILVSKAHETCPSM